MMAAGRPDSTTWEGFELSGDTQDMTFENSVVSTAYSILTVSRKKLSNLWFAIYSEGNLGGIALVLEKKRGRTYDEQGVE